MTREEAIAYFKRHLDLYCVEGISRESEEMAIKALEQEPKTGHWIIIDDCEKFIAKCSECGRLEDSRMINKYIYCPNCGAKMKEPTLNEMRKYYGLEPITKHERS